MFNVLYMQEAMEQAKLAKINNEVPVGAIIVHTPSKKIIAKGFNQVRAYNNPLLHAEINVINSACSILQTKYLLDCDIYVTLEPCAMCAACISFSKIKRLFYAASDKKYGAVENGVRFFTNKNCHFRPEIYIGILSKDAQELMIDFFHFQRKIK